MHPINLQALRVLPVVTAQDEETTVALARALLDGGMCAIEVTLRTPAAMAAIAAVRAELPAMQVAAGTVTTEAELAQVIDAGVTLALSPGCTAKLLAAAAAMPIDFIPGVATASEVMQAKDCGFDVCKLFPATVVGGLDMLRALAGPFPQIQFCPTGGLNQYNFRQFLALPNVVCCGGSWMVSRDLVDNARWDDVTRLAREAMADN